MTEFNHIILGFILAQTVYYTFIRQYDLKFYKEVKKLKSGKSKIKLSPNSLTYDEFIKEKDLH